MEGFGALRPVPSPQGAELLQGGKKLDGLHIVIEILPSAPSAGGGRGSEHNWNNFAFPPAVNFAKKNMIGFKHKPFSYFHVLQARLSPPAPTGRGKKLHPPVKGKKLLLSSSKNGIRLVG